MRVLAVVNARSGGSDTLLYDVIRILGGCGVEVVLRFLDQEAGPDELMGDVKQFDRVIAVGGDGTASGVCYAARGSNVPILVLPTGTANLLASNLGLPTDPPALAELVLNGKPAQFDLGELDCPSAACERTGFAIMAGAGYDAAIMEAAQPMKSTIGPAAYLVAAMSNLSPTAARFELVLDGEHISTDGIAVLLVNFAKIQFDLAVTHGSDPQDGKIEVAVIRSRNVMGLLPAVAAALLDRVGDYPDRSSSIDVYSAASVEVSAYPPLKMQYDGDALDAITPFAARVLPGASTLIVPDETPFK